MAEWQDVTTLAILHTDWAMRKFYKTAPKSLWDELFLRHERERDELLRWEENQNRLKRPMTSSMETLRALPLDTDSDASSSSSSASKGKRRAVDSHRRDSYDGSSSDAESDFPFNESEPTFVRQYTPDQEIRLWGASSPTPSDASVESVPRSVTTVGSASGSEWDMLESSSSSGGSISDDSDEWE
jgi:hypothetical protein